MKSQKCHEVPLKQYYGRETAAVWISCSFDKKDGKGVEAGVMDEHVEF